MALPSMQTQLEQLRVLLLRVADLIEALLSAIKNLEV